jgi:hypothetical protein
MPDQERHISHGEEIPEHELQARFTSVACRPAMAPDLAFRMVLPRDWIELTAPATPVGEDEPSLLGAYKQTDEISVQALGIHLPHEVNLEDWLEYQADGFHLRLGGVEAGDGACGQLVHAVADAPDGAELRLLAASNGPFVALLVGRMPAGAGEAVEEVLGLAAASFDLLAPRGEKTLEPVNLFIDRDGMFQVLHPASWSLSAEDSLRPEKAGVNFRLSDGSDTLAYLRVEADARISLDETGFEQLFQLTLSEIEEAGVTVTDLDPVPGSAERERWVGACSLPSGAGEVALLFRRSSVCWQTAVMLCPAKTANPLAWMRGKRAYEMAVASLSLPADVRLTESAGTGE